MSQFYDYYSFCYPLYDPRLFGYPHLLAAPQPTEPFWQQHQEVHNISRESYPYYHQTYHPIYETMDSQTVYIGKNTKDGEKDALNHKPKFYRERQTHALGVVRVSVRGQVIDDVPLARLVRFSNAARDVFPKPEKGIDQQGKEASNDLKETPKSKEASSDPGDQSEGTADKASTIWAGEAAEVEISVEEVTADIEKLKTPTPANVSTAGTNSEQKSKWLDLDQVDISVLPDATAFKFAFQWMRNAQTSFLEYGVPRPDLCTLQQLIDIHAAALCLDLRPMHRKHIGDLYHRLTTSPPSLEDMQYLHTHLPLDDSVTTRAITSYVRSSEKRHGNKYYTHDQRKALDDYLRDTDRGLASRYGDIVANRDEKSATWKKQRNQDSLQKQAQNIGSGAIDDENEFPSIAVANSTNPSRRRNRRQQERNGRDAEGKVVPGASY